MISDVSSSDLKDKPFNLAFCPNSPSAKYISISLDNIFSLFRSTIDELELYSLLFCLKINFFDLNNLSIRLSLKPAKFNTLSKLSVIRAFFSDDMNELFLSKLISYPLILYYHQKNDCFPLMKSI